MYIVEIINKAHFRLAAT